MTAVTAVVERVGRPYLIEAVRMLEAGLSTVVGIDGALEAAGYERGPLRSLDAVGLDVDLALDQFLQQAEPMTARFDPPPLQLRLVVEGRLGRAVGRGFYRYDTATAPPVPDVEGDARAAQGGHICRRGHLTLHRQAGVGRRRILFAVPQGL